MSNKGEVRGYKVPAHVPVPLQTPVSLQARRKRATSTSKGDGGCKTVNANERLKPDAFPGIKWRAVLAMLIDRAGGTQIALSRETGLSDSTIANYTSGTRRPTKKNGEILIQASREQFTDLERKKVGIA